MFRLDGHTDVAQGADVGRVVAPRSRGSVERRGVRRLQLQPLFGGPFRLWRRAAKESCDGG